MAYGIETLFSEQVSIPCNMSVKRNKVSRGSCTRREKCAFCCFTTFAVVSSTIVLVGLAQIGQPIRCIGELDAWTVHRSARRGADSMTLSAASDYNGRNFTCSLEAGVRLSCGQNASIPRMIFTKQESYSSTWAAWNIQMGSVTGYMQHTADRIYSVRLPGHWINSSKVYLDAPASTSSLHYEKGLLAQYIVGSAFVGEFRICIDRPASLEFSILSVVVPVSYSL